MTSRDSTIRLTAEHPVVWEDPVTLRVGFDRRVATVDVAGVDAQRIVSLLAAGATRPELHEINGLVAERILAALQPALVTAPPHSPAARPAAVAAPATPPTTPLASPTMPPTSPTTPPTSPTTPPATPPATPPFAVRTTAQPPAAHNTARPPAARVAASDRDAGPARQPGVAHERLPIRARISDDGRRVSWLRAALEAGGLCVVPRERRLPELAVEVLRYLEPLGRSSRWQRQGVPLLLVRFTDEFVRVGPIIHPAGAPCHGCEALHLTDRDPALGVIAAQLIGGTPSAERAAVAPFVGALATHLVDAWRRGERWVHHHQLVLPVRAGRAAQLPTSIELAPHPECGCVITARSPPPTRSARAPAPPVPRSQTLTAEANPARA